MKYFFLLLTIVCLSCSKNNHESWLSVDALVINDVEFTGTNIFAVGQFLKIAPSISNGRSDLDFSWTLSPKEDEQIVIGNSQINWRPAKPQQYTLGINVQSNSGEQSSRQYTFKILPADIRYYLWGTRRADVAYSESESLSEKGGDYEAYDDYIVHQTEMEYSRRDAVQPGEHVGYWFEDGVLVAADVYNVTLNQTDPNAHYKKYEEIKLRLSDYNYLGNDNKWLESSEEAMQYKNTPERWGEAFAKGYVTLSDRFDNERTNIRLESYGSDDGNLLIVIRYSQKK